MKKNSTMRAATLLLALTIITTCFVGGTLAKYTSSTSGQDSARVAKWEIVYTDKTTANAKGVDITGANTVTFDLFNTVCEADTENGEENVATGSNNETIIAPGTGGSFTFTVENKSEVDATYTVELTEENDEGIYIQYRLSEDDDWSDDFQDINDKLEDIVLSMGSDPSEITVYWRWAFEGGKDAHKDQSDENDTALGTSETVPSVTVTAKITATQVD